MKNQKFHRKALLKDVDLGIETGCWQAAKGREWRSLANLAPILTILPGQLKGKPRVLSGIGLLILLGSGGGPSINPDYRLYPVKTDNQVISQYQHGSEIPQNR